MKSPHRPTHYKRFVPNDTHQDSVFSKTSFLLETMDNDISDENKAKLRYSQEHFARVNELQEEQRYYFKFLSSESYDFFLSP
jgi:hypothetical protein